MAFTKLDPNFFKGTELDFEDRELRPAVTAAVDGKDKSGKSHFCYDSPDPVAVLSYDFGDEGVVQKFTEKGRKIVIADLKWEIPANMRNPEGTVDKQASGDKLADWIDKNVWRKHVALTKQIIESGQFRTLVVDKATEAWQVCRLSVFGRLATNRQDLQTEANARWREFVRLFKSCELPINLMLIHEQREEWVSEKVASRSGEGSELKWSKSGTWIRDGNEKVPFLIDIGLETRFVPPVKHPIDKSKILHDHKFEVEVKVNRGHPEDVGTIFTHDREQGVFETGWLNIMTTLKPEIPIEAWGHADLRDE